MKYIDELTKEDLEGKRVLLRLDLNAPLDENSIKDTYKLEKSVSTVDFLRGMGAKVIIISHLENKDGGNDSLLPVWNYLNGYFKTDFCSTYFSPEAVDKVLKIEDGGVLLFENIRVNSGEKENDKEFAKKLSQMADIYVNDAFSVCHRNHASIVSLPEFLPHYGGLLLKEEIINLSKVFSPEHPFIFLLGGAKFNTKLPLVRKYLKLADTVFVGGALANDIFKERGYEVGQSLVSKDNFEIKEIINDPKFTTFKDVTVVNSGEVSFKLPTEILKDDSIVDSGPETIEELKEIISNAKTIVWNGPLGFYEKGFSDKTEQLAEIIAEKTQNDPTFVSIVGGGDTVASIQKLNLEHKFTFLSTGGGAMLDYLANETLPGIQALEL